MIVVARLTGRVQRVSAYGGVNPVPFDVVGPVVPWKTLPRASMLPSASSCSGFFTFDVDVVFDQQRRHVARSWCSSCCPPTVNRLLNDVDLAVARARHALGRRCPPTSCGARSRSGARRPRRRRRLRRSGSRTGGRSRPSSRCRESVRGVEYENFVHDMVTKSEPFVMSRLPSEPSEMSSVIEPDVVGAADDGDRVVPTSADSLVVARALSLQL